MLGVTIIDSYRHVGSQALGEVRHRLVNVFLWQIFPYDLQGDFQLISRRRLQLEFMVLFQHGAPDVIVQRVQIWRAWGPLIVLNEPGTVRLLLYDARTLNWVVLVETSWFCLLYTSPSPRDS